MYKSIKDNPPKGEKDIIVYPLNVDDGLINYDIMNSKDLDAYNKQNNDIKLWADIPSDFKELSEIKPPIELEIIILGIRNSNQIEYIMSNVHYVIKQNKTNAKNMCWAELPIAMLPSV